MRLLWIGLAIAAVGFALPVSAIARHAPDRTVLVDYILGSFLILKGYVLIVIAGLRRRGDLPPDDPAGR
jgi:hypothetical protein